MTLAFITFKSAFSERIVINLGGEGGPYSNYSFAVTFLTFTFMENKFSTANIKNSKRISRACKKQWPNKIRPSTHNYKKSSLYLTIGFGMSVSVFVLGGYEKC